MQASVVAACKALELIVSEVVGTGYGIYLDQGSNWQTDLSTAFYQGSPTLYS